MEKFFVHNKIQFILYFNDTISKLSNESIHKRMINNFEVVNFLLKIRKYLSVQHWVKSYFI